MLKGLILFKRICHNDKPTDSFTVLSWHNPKSLTWRLSVTYHKKPSGEAGMYFIRTYTYKKGLNFQAGVNRPRLGSLSIQTQPHMWL